MDRKYPHGFTLVELLVVISIIGILSVIAMAALSFARGQARIAKARHDVDTLVTAVKSLEADTGFWPGHQEVDELTETGSNEIWDLSVQEAGLVDTDGLFGGWNGPYIGTIPLDPWGNNYFWDSDYELDGRDHVVVGSFGPNGVGQNLYDSDDIVKVLR